MFGRGRGQNYYKKSSTKSYTLYALPPPPRPSPSYPSGRSAETTRCLDHRYRYRSGRPGGAGWYGQQSLRRLQGSRLRYPSDHPGQGQREDLSRSVIKLIDGLIFVFDNLCCIKFRYIFNNEVFFSSFEKGMYRLLMYKEETFNACNNYMLWSSN